MAAPLFEIAGRGASPTRFNSCLGSVRYFAQIRNTELVESQAVAGVAQMQKRRVSIKRGPLGEAAHRSEDIIAPRESAEIFHRNVAAAANGQPGKLFLSARFVAANQEGNFSSGKLTGKFLHPGGVARNRKKVFSAAPVPIVAVPDVDSHNYIRGLPKPIHDLFAGPLVYFERPEISANLLRMTFETSGCAKGPAHDKNPPGAGDTRLNSRVFQKGAFGFPVSYRIAAKEWRSFVQQTGHARSVGEETRFANDRRRAGNDIEHASSGNCRIAAINVTARRLEQVGVSVESTIADAMSVFLGEGNEIRKQNDTVGQPATPAGNDERGAGLGPSGNRRLGSGLESRTIKTS